MERKWLVFCGSGSVWGSTGWYMVVLSQYNLVLLSIKLYLVGKLLVCLYILGKVEIWSGVTDALIYLYHDFHNVFPTFPSSSNTSCGLLLNGVFGPFFIEGRRLGVVGVVLNISDPSDK